MAERIDLFGTPQAYNHYAVGWAHAMDTPYQWTKQVGIALGRHTKWDGGALAQRHQGQGRDAEPVPSRDRRRADGARGRWHSGSVVRATASSRRRSRASRWPTPSKTPDAEDRHTTQYFEMFVQPRYLPRGLDGGDAPLRPVGRDDRQASRSTTTSGSCTARTTGPRRATWRTESRSGSLISSASSSSRPASTTSCPLDDRRVERFNADIAGRPQLIQGNTQVLFGGMGRLSENSLARAQEQVSRGHGARSSCPEGGAQRDDRGPGRCVRRLEPVHDRGQAGVLLQPVRPAAVQGLRRRRRFRPASTRSGSSSPTTAAGSGRAATCGALRRRQPRSGRAASTPPCRWPSRPTRRPTSATTPGRR